MFGIFDIYLLEALLNGVLLGGVFALLALGLNLLFGVIDVVWICYAELIMLGMYGMYFLFAFYHVPCLLAARICVGGIGVLGSLLHVLVIQPLLGTAPINQLLATGGVLFLLQSAATVMFGIDFRNLGIRLPILEIADMFVSYARLLAFGAALAGMVALYLFLARSYTGAAIRAIAQDRQIMVLMGVDTRRIYLITSAIGGSLAGLAACLLVLMYDVHPFIGLSIGPITFLICVLGGLGNFVGGFVAAFVFAEFIFMGIGAYVTALLWNHLGISPWLGIPIALACAGALALVVGYPCFRFRITGHYFALVTLALSGIVLQIITATRDYTGGSLGYTPERYQGGSSLWAFQFGDKTTWYLIALAVWAAGLYVWNRVDRSMLRY